MIGKLQIGKNLVPTKDNYYNYDLRNARIKAGYSIKQLAELVGVHYTAINHLERLRYLPNLLVAKKLAEVLHKNIEELFPEQLKDCIREIQRERKGSEDDALEYAHSLDDGLGFRIRNSSEENLPVIAGREELQRRMRNVLRTLSYREREVIKLRYGLEDGYSYTLEEVSHIFRVTRDRIRQIEAKAVRKLQQPSRTQELVGFLD